MRDFTLASITKQDYVEADKLIESLKYYEASLLSVEDDTSFITTENLLKRDNSIVIIAKSESEIVGIVRGYEQGSYYYLSDLYVDKNARRLGIGKALYLEFRKECALKKVKSIVIPTLAINEIAQEFYRRLGAEKMYIQYEVKV